MVFSRLFFIYIFLPLCLITYAAAGSIKNKNTVLIIFSLIFYAWGEPVYVFLMLLSAVVNYFAGLIIGKYQGTGKDTAATAAAVVFDFLMLGIFKYSGFIVENINAVFSAFRISSSLSVSVFTRSRQSHTSLTATGKR